jgi:hypothetical protein
VDRRQGVEAVLADHRIGVAVTHHRIGASHLVAGEVDRPAAVVEGVVVLPVAVAVLRLLVAEVAATGTGAAGARAPRCSLVMSALAVSVAA